MATQTKETEPGKKRTEGLVQDVKKDSRSLKTFFTKFGNDWAAYFAGMLAYNLLMAMLPIAIALIAILGLVLNGLNPDAVQSITSQLSHIFPGAAGQQNTLDLAEQQLRKDAGILSTIAIVLALFGGSRLFVTIENCLDIIYRVRPRTFIPQNLMAIGMLLLFIILIPIMIVASTGPTLVFSLLKQTPLATVPGINLLIGLGGVIGAFLVGFILFLAIYIVVPNQRIRIRNSWCGALVAAILLEIFLVLFPVYIASFLKGYAGPIGFAVILMLFFYYFAIILLLGAEINAFFFEGVQPIPNELATFVSTMAGTLNKDIPDVESSVHQNPKPTESADKAHVAETRNQERQARRTNAQKQSQVAAKELAQANGSKDGTEVETTQADKTKTTRKGQLRLTTVIEVVAGTVLAFVVELLRLRQRQPN